MGIVPEQVRDQLRSRFETRLTGPVHLSLYTRPGSSRLILPSGMGCETCGEAREIAETLRDVAPEKISVDLVDVTRDDAPVPSEITDVPTLALSSGSNGSRIRFQGLPAGTEFAALIDAVERVSRNEHGLSQSSISSLARLTEPVEVMHFATPT